MASGAVGWAHALHAHAHTHNTHTHTHTHTRTEVILRSLGGARLFKQIDANSRDFTCYHARKIKLRVFCDLIV